MGENEFLLAHERFNVGSATDKKKSDVRIPSRAPPRTGLSRTELSARGGTLIALTRGTGHEAVHKLIQP